MVTCGLREANKTLEANRCPIALCQTETTNVKDLTLNLGKGEADVTARGNDGCGRRRDHPSSMIFRPIRLARCRRLSMWSP